MRRTVSLLASVASAVLLACGVVLITAPNPAEGAAKPNVLLVLVDDAHPSMVKRIPAVREKLVQ